MCNFIEVVTDDVTRYVNADQVCSVENHSGKCKLVMSNGREVYLPYDSVEDFLEEVERRAALGGRT